MSEKKKGPFRLINILKRGSSDRWNKRSTKAKSYQGKHPPSFPPPKPPSETLNKLTQGGSNNFEASGYYDSIENSFVSKSNFNDTYISPIERGVSQGRHYEARNRPLPYSDENDYLEMVAEMDKASEEIMLDQPLFHKKEAMPPALPPKSLALYDEEDKKRESELNSPEKIQAILEKQKVTLRTLYVNTEHPPDVPPRNPLDSFRQDSIDMGAGEYVQSDIYKPRMSRSEGSIDIALGEYVSCHDYKITSAIGSPQAAVEAESVDQFVNSLDQIEGRSIEGTTDDTKSELSSETCPDVIVCITGVPENITKENMMTFLEKEIPISRDSFKVILGENGLVVVEFFEKIEGLDVLDKALQKGPPALDFCQVFTPKSVLISSNEVILDVQDLKSYFNHFNSYGKPIEVTSMDYGMMDVTFDNHKAVYAMCAKSTYYIQGEKVYVSPFYKSKFGNVWSKELHKKTNLPSDISLDKIEPLLASFLTSSASDSAVQCLNKNLSEVHAKLFIEKNKKNISIRCLLTPKTAGVNVKAVTWRDNATEIWEKSISNLISQEEIHVPEEHVNKVKKWKRHFEQKGMEGIFVEFHDNPDDFWLKIIGLAENVKRLCDCYRSGESIKIFVKHVQLPSRQVNRMEHEGFFVRLESKYDVVIEKDFVHGEILIRGAEIDVDQTKHEISSHLRLWTFKNIPVDQKRIDELSKSAINEDATRKVTGEEDEENTYEQLDNLKEEETYDTIVNDCKTMRCRHGTTISVVSGELGKQKADVLVCSTNADLKLGIAGVGRNLLQKGGQILQIECENKYPNGIKIGDVAKVSGGRLDCKCIYLGILPHWDEEKSQLAKNTLSKLVYDCLKKASTSKKGLKSVAFPALGTGALRYPVQTVVEWMYKGVMDFDAESIKCLDVSFVIFHKDTSTLKTFEDYTDLLTSRHCYITPKRHISVNIEQISLASKPVDVMVCNTSKDLEFGRSMLLMTIQYEGGDEMKNDCCMKYPRGIKAGELAVVKPGGLPCKRIYFGFLPPYKENPQNAEKALSKLVFDSLDMASKYGKSSVAFPPLGTGVLGYPHSMSARLMYNAIKEFDKKTELSSIKEIYITILSKDLKSLDAFFAEDYAQS